MLLYSPIFSLPFYFTVLYLGQFHCHLFSLFLVQYRIFGIHFKGNFMLSSNSLPIIFADSLQNRESRKLGGRENKGEYSISKYSQLWDQIVNMQEHRSVLHRWTGVHFTSIQKVNSVDIWTLSFPWPISICSSWTTAAPLPSNRFIWNQKTH